MANSEQLRQQRTGTIINNDSKKQEKNIKIALGKVVDTLRLEYPDYTLSIMKSMTILEQEDITGRSVYAENKKSSIRPDGGFILVEDKHGNKKVVLASEVKRQGTNDKRKLEGKPKQAQGNAIERLGKNVAWMRNLFLDLDIHPFICFGEGCDFEDGSKIRDRVVTIAGQHPLNVDNLYKVKSHTGETTSTGSYYFRGDKWTPEEMYKKMISTARSAVKYYEEKSLLKR